MKTKRSLLTFSFLIILMTACAPDASATNPPVTALPTEVLPTAPLAALTLEPTNQAAPAEEVTALPVATSRGPDLHATDPTSVSLASGELQFVEFFRFT